MAVVEKPAKMDEKTVKKLEEAFSMDCSIKEVCLHANISKQCLYNWMESFPKMKERFDELRATPFLKARQTIIKSLDDPNHAFKYMERKKKKEFGVNMDISTDGKPIPMLYAIQNNNSNPEDKSDEGEDKSSAGGNVSE